MSTLWDVLRDLPGVAVAWLAVGLAGGAAAAAVRAFVPAARRPFPPQRWRAAGWTGPLVAATFLVFFLLPALLLPLAAAAPLGRWILGHDADAVLTLRLAQCAANLLTLPPLVAVWWGLRTAAGGEFGRPWSRAAADAVAGYRTWLVVTPATYTVSFVVLLVYGWVVGKQPEEHPILQSFQQGPAPLGLVLLFIAEAVVAAPVREELFFRGTLQPWLAARPWGGDFALALAGAAGVLLRLPAALRDPAAVLSALAPAVFVLALLPLYRLLDFWAGLARWLPLRDPATRRAAARAVFGAAAMFANFHANVWPTPVPLFVLALGLGWLAVRTQGVVAPIAMHMLFNAVAFGALAWR